MISFFFCLVFGFIPIYPQPQWLGIFWFVVACLCFVPTLYLPFHVSSGMEDVIDLESRQDDHIIKRKKQRYLLALWLVICFPLFPINYLLAAFGVIGYGETIGVYFLLSVLMKAFFSAVTMDVHSTAQMDAEKALEEEKKANAARRDFLKYIFHEVRTPLNSLTMGIEILRQGSHMLPTDLELLSVMKSASDFMADTLNDVLSLQKIEEGKLELELSPFSISDSVTKVLSTFHGAVLTKQINVVKSIAFDVPNRLIGDRYRVEHVLSNLLSNAIKFSPEKGDIFISVVLSTLIPYDNKSVASVTVSVSDKGPGISAENQKKLFGNFVQIRPGQLQQGQGSGLGLSLCKQIVTLHGGTIWVESSEGQGSTFSFCIPFTVFYEPSLSDQSTETDNLVELFRKPSQDSISEVMQDTARKSLSTNETALTRPTTGDVSFDSW